MKKTFTLVKNFKALSVFAGLIFVAGTASAQVVHTNVNKTLTAGVPGESLDIDMDNDGTVDFNVSITDASSIGFGNVAIVSIGDAATASVAVDDLDNEAAIAFSAGDAIGSSQTWDPDGAGLFTTADGGDGNFLSVTNKFIGVQFTNLDGSTFFGYIGVSTTSNTITIKDYAFEKTADASIDAGAGATAGISSYVKSNTTIKNINNTIVAEFAKAFNGKMEVVNMNGQVVKSTTVNGISTSVSMEDAPTGIYQVVVSCADGFATEKVVVASK